MKKKKKTIGSKPIGNHTIIGIVCLVIALGVCFGIAPLVNHITEGKIKIVRVVNPLEKGDLIEEKDIEVVEIGSYNLDEKIIKDKEEVIGKYANAKLFSGDYFTSDKITEKENTEKNILETLGNGKKAISISIEDFALGFSGKICKNDIISIYYYDSQDNKVINPGELKYVKVITSTTSQGIDKEDVSDNTQPVTVTLLVDEKQAEVLVKLEQTSNMHLALVYRGDEDTANKYLAEQEKYLNGGVENEG